MSRFQDVILRGTRAAQPAAADPGVGALYCVTDEDEIIEQSTGAAWVAFSPPAPSTVILRGTRAAQPAANTVVVGTLYGVTDEGNLVERSNGAAWEAYSPAGVATAVTAAAVIDDHAIVRGDGGARGVQKSGVTISDADAVAGMASLAVAVALAANSKATFGGTVAIPPYDNGNSGAAKTIDWALSNEQLLTMTGNCALTFSNPTPGGRYVLLVSTGAGGFALTFPGAVRWGTPGSPTLTLTAGKIDLFTFMYHDGAGLYLGGYQQNY